MLEEQQWIWKNGVVNSALGMTMVAITIIAIMITMGLDEVMAGQRCDDVEIIKSQEEGCDENYIHVKAAQNSTRALAVTRQFRQDRNRYKLFVSLESLACHQGGEKLVFW